MKNYYVYILGNKTNSTLYIGVTNNLEKRVFQHKNKLVDGFSKKYNINKLLYYEQGNEIMSVIVREKQLKKWRREKKIELIKTINPKFKDLSNDW